MVFQYKPFDDKFIEGGGGHLRKSVAWIELTRYPTANTASKVLKSSEHT
ncbi:hypothetical protein ADIS_2444 [Lunatimonas lonarensis]|uniref:Uncharacterized protein n=1 Tax=Lunatimonas lonarensis TaxID=1232681 RepID=R7ZSJ9_9BACT|nr:hypothetical protein ADIS_2444 [Lunatimonas lonarensis]